VALHRKDLLTILADSIQSKIEFNKSVSDITFDHVDIAKVTFSDNVTENFNLVIGADGINSTLRRTLTQPHSLEDLGISTWRFIANFQQADPIYYFGKQSAFMIYPISKTQAYCYAHTSDPTDKRLIKKEQLPLVFSDYTAKVNEIIDATPRDNIIFGRLTSVTKPIFSYHNIAFIGDAAHACSPMLQQGAALAFEDAITLSQIINKTKNIKKILSYYEAIREPRVTWVRENSDGPIKSMAFSQSDDEYNKRNQLIKTNGPINIQKWKVLFSKNYINELNDQILLYL
jgi:2-polyprenyl-6-methoxyphenol hydroxylase-like FAD-dependent oxidoreductase